MRTLRFLATALVAVASLSATNAYAQRVDTIYYDDNWKGVESKQFASYVRYASYAEDSNYKNRYRDYYITGQLQADGEFEYIDKYDDSKSRLGASKTYYKDGTLLSESTIVDGNGKYVKYYENGKKEFECEVADGEKNGTEITYYENGLIHTKANYKNGKYEGIFYEFSEDGGTCEQLEFLKGDPLTSYYTLSTSDGYVAKYRLSDNSLYLEEPSLKEQQPYYENGHRWDCYQKNAICLMLKEGRNYEYGKYFTLHLVVANNSLQPITFDPAKIVAYCTKKDKTKPLRVLSANEYIRKVQRRQNTAAFFNALGESMQAQQAGYSTSTTNTHTNYGGASVSTVGSTVGTNVYAGSSNTSSRTISYDGAAAYQAQIIASDRIASFNNDLMQDRQVREAGYLKKTTINPGETISGYVNVVYSKGEKLYINIPIEGIKYPYIYRLK